MLLDGVKSSLLQVTLAIDPHAVPLLPGVHEALAAGIKSSAFASNAQRMSHVECAGGDAGQRLLPALWDPQTSGARLLLQHRVFQRTRPPRCGAASALDRPLLDMNSATCAQLLAHGMCKRTQSPT